MLEIEKHHANQFKDNQCPVCKQMLPNNIETIYQYYQEANDTANELNICKKEMKEIQSEINSIEKRIKNNREAAKERE